MRRRSAETVWAELDQASAPASDECRQPYQRPPTDGVPAKAGGARRRAPPLQHCPEPWLYRSPLDEAAAVEAFELSDFHGWSVP